MFALPRLSSQFPLRRLAVSLAALLLAASAQAGPPRPGAVLVFPRVELDSSAGVDTEVMIASRSTSPVSLFCWYVAALGTCGGGFNGPTCRTDADCVVGLSCVSDCREMDFIISLQPRQVVQWEIGSGLYGAAPPLDHRIPATPTDPFLGALRCVASSSAVDVIPAARNDLYGSASIVHANPPDSASYAALAIEATGTNNGDTTLCFGANSGGPCPVAEYAPCPAVLVLDHFFEGASLDGAPVRNELMLVPCSVDLTQAPGSAAPTTVDVLVFNEFEERRCTTLSVGCAGDVRMSTNPVFSVGVQGTLAGQTRLRARSTLETAHGTGVLGLALESAVTAGRRFSAAHALAAQSQAVQNDSVRLIDLP